MRKKKREQNPGVVLYQKLDVGCGQNPCGSVNTDCYRIDIRHNRIPEYYELNTKKIPNFILCDAQHLPFRNKSFKTANSSHVIEHVQNPALMLQELARVTTQTITIECPHRYGEKLKLFQREYTRKWMRQHHKNHFSPKWFTEQANKLGWKSESTTIKTMRFPHNAFSFIELPYYFKTVLTKKK